MRFSSVFRAPPKATFFCCVLLWVQAGTIQAATATKVAAGQDHSLVLKSDGSLWAMGWNYFGPLGDGTRADSHIPELIVPAGVKAIATGSTHSLFIKSDGSLWGMGDNHYGQLGNTTTPTPLIIPEQIVPRGVTTIAAGENYSLFLKSDGSLWVMGDNGYGQLGDGNNTSEANTPNVNAPQKIVSGGIKAIAAGDNHSLFLKNDGSLWGMGDNEFGQLGDGSTAEHDAPVQIVARGVTAIAAGSGYSLFLKSDGSLWAMGNNQYGQLGDGITTYGQTNLPERIVSGNVTAVAAGGDHSCFLKSDGSFWAMGDNNYGCFGDGTTTERDTPVQILSAGVNAIASAYAHSLFIKVDGSLWGMGYNWSGQLGDGTADDKHVPEQIAVPANSLLVQINGNGKVTPDYNGQILQVNGSYTMNAKPGIGYLFSNWTGSVVSGKPTLTFIGQANMALQANFIANPFIPAAGTYEGLISNTNEPPQEQSGFFKATITDGGAFSAKILWGGTSYSPSGQFSTGGAWLNSIARNGQIPFSVQLQLDLAGCDTMSGTVGDGISTATMTAHRAAFSNKNPAPQMGEYTLAILDADDSSVLPAGVGFGTVKVDMSGNVTFAGALADGTKVSQTTFVSKQGAWPFYASLYQDQGMLSGWLTFTNTNSGSFSNLPPSYLSGALDWIKPPMPTAKFYPAGFDFNAIVIGSSYTNNMLNFTNGLVAFSNGNLPQIIFNQLVIGSNNTVADLSLTNKMSLTFKSSSGLFGGTLTLPGDSEATAFSGAFLQIQGFGYGYFLRTNQSGTIFFGPSL